MIIMSNPPLQPLPFDEQPIIHHCIRSNVRIQNHDSLQEVLLQTSVRFSVESQLNQDPNKEHNDNEDESLFDDDFSFSSEASCSSVTEDESEDCADASKSYDAQLSADTGNRIRMRAFWLRKEPHVTNHHGIWTTFIYFARVLHKADLFWVLADEQVAVKTVSWRCIRASQHRLSENFLDEICGLQYLSKFIAANFSSETNVLTVDTVMSDDSQLYIVMPYCPGGDLCQRVAECQKLAEDQARFWFKQILKALETLQHARICHRDLSPENIVFLDDNSLLVDFGMCLRIPYSQDGVRHLIIPHTPCGKLPHMSPEIYRRLPFDGHAVDLWAAGTILLYMLTGKRLTKPPLYDRPLEGIALGLSYNATDLLRKMFRLDPNDRLTLEQIRSHPFVTTE